MVKQDFRGTSATSSNSSLNDRLAPSTTIQVGAKGLCVLVFWSGVCVVSFGVLVGVKWYAHWSAVVRLGPARPAMKLNAALCFILCGLALSLTVKGKRVAIAIAAAAAVIAAATLYEYSVGHGTGIDQLLIQDYLTPADAFPGRMSPLTALCFLFIGGGLVSSGVDEISRWRLGIICVSAFLVFFIAAIAVSGFLAGIEAVYGWGLYTHMASHTAIGLIWLSLSLLLWAGTMARRQHANLLRWLPFAGSVTLMAMVGLLAVISLHTLKTAYGARKANYDTLVCAEALRASLTDSQRDLRTYLLTAQPEALEIYQHSIASAPQLLAQLNNLAQDNRSLDLEKWLAPLTVDVGRVTTYSEHVLAARESFGLQAVNLELNGNGREIASRTRGHLQALTDAVRRQLVTSDMQAERTFISTTKLLILVSLLATALLVLAHWMTRRELNRRKRAEATLEETSSHSRALYKVTGTIIEQQQLPALLQTVVDTVAGALPADRVTLIMFDVQKRLVTNFATGGAGFGIVVRVTFEELWRGLSGWVLRTGNPALSAKNVPDPREESDVQSRRQETNCGDIMVVPIRFQERIVGTLTAINCPQDAEFEEKHVALMTAMAGHVAIAISNIGLFEELTDNARELHVTTERLTLATDAARMGIWEWDPATNTFRWDDQMYQIYDCVRSGDVELYSRWTDTVHAEDRQRAERELHAAFHGDVDLNTEYRIMQPDGAVRHLRASARVQRDANGTPLRLVGVTFDTTERNEAVARAQTANLAKSQFLANMSHEIRTPLNAIIGLGYLLEQTLLSAEQRSFLAKIQFAGRSLLSVVNNVLDLSKIEAGEMILEETGFDVVNLVQQIGQMLAPQAQAKGVDLLVSPAGELPRLLRGDATRLRQILTNLVNNAVKFTERGRVTLDVSCVRQSAASIRLRCTVTDTGIGIGPAGIARLFMPFAQADTSTTRRFGGTGLGLSIARRFVELMGGEIGVTSVLAVGSEFWVEVPLRIAHESDLDGTGQSMRPLHILILEAADSSITLASLVRPLGWLPHTVRRADDVVARLRVSSGGAWPDVIVIDGALQDFNPLQFVTRLRMQFAHVELPPVIVIDDALQSYRQLEPLRQLVSVVLPPPVGSSALFNAVNSALTMRDGNHQSALQATHFDQVIAQWLSGAQILVVDDSEVNRVVAQHILVKQGATVAMCSNGAQAVERLRADPEAFDVVLMDVQMPELDGNEATQQIRRDLNLKTLPIIALTAGALVSERERAFEAGMNDFLSKPLEPVALIRVVRRFVELKRGAPLPVGIVDKEPHRAGVAAGLASVDATVVQQMFGGDEELFASLLQRVLHEFGEFALPIAVEFPDSVARKHWASKLHKLRGSAAVIGAKAVQRLAGAGERALEEGQPAEFVAAILRQLAAELTALGEEVRPLLEGAAARVAAKADDSACDLPAKEIMMTELVDLLDSQNLDAIERCKAMTASLTRALGEARFARLRDAVEGLEFSQAALILRSTPTVEGSIAARRRGA